MFFKNADTSDEIARTIVVGEPKPQMTKLPFWSSVAEAYRATFRNLGVLFRISWAWIFLLAYAVAMLAVAQAVGITTMPGNGATEKGLLIGLAFIVWIASSIASASIAVAPTLRCMMPCT